MAHQVTIGGGYTNVQLPNGLFYKAGDVVVLTDAQFDLLDPDAIADGILIDNGEVDANDLVSVQATHVGAAAALTSSAPAALTSSQNATTAASDPTTTQALANALKASYNQAQTDIATLRTELGQVQADLVAVRTTLNAALAALTGTGKAMA